MFLPFLLQGGVGGGYERSEQLGYRRADCVGDPPLNPLPEKGRGG